MTLKRWRETGVGIKIDPERAEPREQRRRAVDQKIYIATIQAVLFALQTVPTEHIVAVYRNAVVEQAHSHDSEQARQHLHVVTAAYRELRRRREELKVLPLLDDPDPRVRSVTAGALLPLATEKAQRVLEELASGPAGVIRTGAEQTLKRWRATGVGGEIGILWATSSFREPG